MLRTLKLMILPDCEQTILLRQMTEQYRQACNFVSSYTFEHGIELNSFRLQKALYTDVREKFKLKAQMSVSVFRTVTARYKTVETQLQQKPYKIVDKYDLDKKGKPKVYKIPRDLGWLKKPIEFKRPQVDLVLSRDYSFDFEKHMLSLNTLGRRIKVGYVDSCWKHYFDGSWTFGTGKIVSLKGKWYFHIPVSKEISTTPVFDRKHVMHVVGIDRGLRFITTTYDEVGKCSFESGHEAMKVRENYVHLRARLQRKGTRSAKRILNRLSGQENRWMTDVNHQLSKTLVEKYGPNTLFVLEDLVDVSFEEDNLKGSAKSNRQKRSWAFYQFEQFLTYKAAAIGSMVLKVPANYTSQRCPRCGTICKDSRDHHNHEYVCHCGYRGNDDRVGAHNLYLLGTQYISGDEHPRIRKNTSGTGIS